MGQSNTGTVQGVQIRLLNLICPPWIASLAKKQVFRAPSLTKITEHILGISQEYV